MFIRFQTWALLSLIACRAATDTHKTLFNTLDIIGHTFHEHARNKGTSINFNRIIIIIVSHFHCMMQDISTLTN